jgi:lipoprotein-anchoring transpeptidase ErfK/SrfK
MKWIEVKSGAAIFCLLLATTGCEQVPKKPIEQKPAVTQPAKQPPKSYWAGDGVKGKPSIVISLSEQRGYFYKDGRLIGETNISTGRKGFETPPGTYKVIQKDKNHVSNLYGKFVDAGGGVVKENADMSKDPVPKGAVFSGAKMPYFMRITGGYGLHAGYVPRHRASHGCIRLPHSAAGHFFDAAEIGTPVTVKE